MNWKELRLPHGNAGRTWQKEKWRWFVWTSVPPKLTSIAAWAAPQCAQSWPDD